MAGFGETLLPRDYGGGYKPPSAPNIDPLMEAFAALSKSKAGAVQQQQYEEGQDTRRSQIKAETDIAAGVQAGQDRRQQAEIMEKRRMAWDAVGDSLTKAALSGDMATFKAGLANVQSQGWKAEQEMVGPSDFGMPDPAPPAPMPAPTAMAMPGMPPAPMAPPAPPPQAPKVPTGKYIIHRPDGQGLELDLSQMRMDQKAAIQPYIDAMVAQAPRLEKAPMKQAANAFMMDPTAIASGVPGFSSQVEKQVIPITKEEYANERAAQMAAAQSQHQQSGSQIPLISLQQRAINDATNSVTKAYATGDVHKAQQALARVDSLVKSGGSLQQREAILQQLRAALGSARQSNQQLDHLMSSGGVFTQFETGLNRWTNEGKLSPELVKELVAAGKAVNGALHDTLTDAGEAAYDGIMNDTTLLQTMGPDLQEQAARRARAQVVGETLGTPKHRPPRVGAEGGGGDGQSSSVTLKGAPAYQQFLEATGNAGP